MSTRPADGAVNQSTGGASTAAPRTTSRLGSVKQRTWMAAGRLRQGVQQRVGTLARTTAGAVDARFVQPARRAVDERYVQPARARWTAAAAAATAERDALMQVRVLCGGGSWGSHGG